MTTHDDDSQNGTQDEPRDESESRHRRSEQGGGESGRRRSGASDCRGGGRGRHRRRHHRHGGRKERVLHTRISEQLSDDIRRLADDLRVPTSNLVRNVLEEVFTMVESVSEDVGELFEDVLDEAQEARERVRKRAARQRARGEQPADRSDTRSRFDDSVERELRRDEAKEGVARQSPARGDDTASADSSEAASPSRPEFADVMGWQPLVLNHERTCAGCGVALRRGAHAFIGLGRQGLMDTTVCRACAGSAEGSGPL